MGMGTHCIKIAVAKKEVQSILSKEKVFVYSSESLV